jgi:hypothetical protein
MEARQMTAQPPVHDHTRPGRGAQRFGAALLALTGLFTLALVMNHPTLGARHDIQAVAVGIQALARADRLVHGLLMLVLCLQAIGFYIFSARLGWRSPAVGAGFVAFAAGVVVMTIPATLDGFVTPDLAIACLKLPAGCAAPDAGAFRLVAVMIQDFTKLALILMSAAALGWGLALVFRRGWLNLLAGLIGVACAAVPAWVLLTSQVTLRPDNLAQVIAAQVVWSLVAAGVLLQTEKRP